MAIAITIDSATISTTEYSLPGDAAKDHTAPGVTFQTDDCVLQAFIDLSNMAAGDEFEIKIYDAINASAPLLIYQANLVGAQSSQFVSPALIVGEGWDVTVKKIAGTDRSIGWSLRKVA